MTKQGLVGLLFVGGLVAAVPARASDPWETAGIFGADDSNVSRNTLSHGAVQIHDLDQAGAGIDQDWMIVPTIATHSYEARVYGGHVQFDWGQCPGCAQFERVSAAGAVLTEDVGVVNDGSGLLEESYDRSVRWMATASTTHEFVRVTGGGNFANGPNSVYTIRYWDTTYSIPRWNNSNGQTTVFLINSMVQAPAQVRVDFYNAAGTLLTSATTTVGPHQLFALNTASLGPLAGQSGHAYVSHTAGYGGLAGKAVALDPATGFSFDTPMVPIPD
jgi:hypothetical protein